MSIGLNLGHWYGEFIDLCRVLTVLLGSCFAGVLLLTARRFWGTLGRGERYGFWTLVVYSVSVVLFAILELANRVVPVIPNSLVYVGWVFSFVLGYQALYHSRRIR